MRASLRCADVRCASFAVVEATAAAARCVQDAEHYEARC
jgi:hypothetical protein